MNIIRIIKTLVVAGVMVLTCGPVMTSSKPGSNVTSRASSVNQVAKVKPLTPIQQQGKKVNSPTIKGVITFENNQILIDGKAPTDNNFYDYLIEKLLQTTSIKDKLVDKLAEWKLIQDAQKDSLKQDDMKVTLATTVQTDAVEELITSKKNGLQGQINKLNDKIKQTIKDTNIGFDQINENIKILASQQQ